MVDIVTIPEAATSVLTGLTSDLRVAERDRVEITVAGRAWSGWTEVSIEIGIDNLASAFELSSASRERAASTAVLELAAGAAAEVSIGGTTVVTGFIDITTPGMSADEHMIRLRGRSKAADLVDCSAVASPGSWANRTMAQIAAELLQPFGIPVVIDGNAGDRFARFSLQQGESVLEALSRMARMRGLIVFSRSDGSVAIASPRPTGAAVRLALGDNLLRIDGYHDASNRFSRYIVKGQSAGSNETNGRTANQMRAEADDPGITRHRPLLILAEDQGTPASLRARARWEATTRAAQSQGATARVRGWRRPDGNLWQPLQLVDLDAPAVGISGQLMVAGVRFALSDAEGVVADLTLAIPEAYTPQPMPAESRADRISSRRRA